MKNKKLEKIYNIALPICLVSLGTLIAVENINGTIVEIIRATQIIVFAVSGSIVIKIQKQNN